MSVDTGEKSMAIEANGLIQNLDHKFSFKNIAQIIKSGDNTCLEEIIVKGDLSDINEIDKNGRSYLSIAAEEGQFSCAKILLDHGADLGNFVKNSDGVYKFNQYRNNAALYKACERGHYDIINLLSKHGADSYHPYNPPLNICAYKGDLKLAQLLIKYGAIVDNRVSDRSSVVHDATYSGNAELVEYLISKGGKSCIEPLDGRHTALLVACRCENIDVIKVLLKHMIEKDEYTMKTSLLEACYKNNTDMIRVVLEHGANKTEYDIYDIEDRSPFYIAYGNKDAIRLFLQHGVELNHRCP